MKKKKIIVLCLFLSLFFVGFVFAQNKPNGQPFKAIWEAINSLQEQMDNDEERITSLEARVAELEKLHEEPEPGIAIIQDNFNTYTNGSIVGQGNWDSYVNGGNFIVQGSTVFEGEKALYNNTQADSVITKAGTSLSDGRQAFYIRTENRANWGSNPDGNAQLRLNKEPWSPGGLPFAAVTFRNDGNVAYFDPIDYVYKNFATYNDNEWTLVEIEWRSSDNKARYRINSGTWTDWSVFYNSVGFTDFDHIGFDFYLPSGSGGVYFDTLY